MLNLNRVWTFFYLAVVAISVALACVSINRAFPFALSPMWHHYHERSHAPASTGQSTDSDLEPMRGPRTTTPRYFAELKVTTAATYTRRTKGTRKSRTSTTTSRPTIDLSRVTILPELGLGAETDEQVQSRYKSRVLTLDFKPNRVSFAPLPVKAEEIVTVTTNSGSIEGVKGQAMNKQVVAFLGIPYAEPPVDSRRFSRPVPVKQWASTLKADTWTPHCPQVFGIDTTLSRTLTTLHMSEDCLYLNIWTPTVGEEASKSVLIYVQGNGFKGGTAALDELDGRVLASHGDIVVVTFNYRLGAFGFLEPDVPDIPGNMGIYDCAQAIEWVQENVRYFGGDPEKITLAGHYSGAVTVGMFMLSDKYKSYFRRAIIQSGSPLFQETMSHEGLREGLATSRLFLEQIGCDYNATYGRTVSCLADKSTEEIIAFQQQLIANDEHHFDVNQCDGELSSSMSFFEAIRSPQAMSVFSELDDVLFGTNQDELSLSLVLSFPDLFTPQKIKFIIATLRELRELILRLFSLRSGIEEKQSIKFMADYFFSDGEQRGSTADLVQKMYRAFGDAAVGCPVNILAEEFSKLGKKVYVYEFAQRSRAAPWAQWMGVPFSSEQPFVFGHPLRHSQRYSRDDVDVSKRMIRMWSQFVKTGSLGSQLGRTWKPYTNETQEYVQINSKEATFGSRATNEVCNLFRFTLIEYNSTTMSCPASEDVTDLYTETTTGETTTVTTELPLLNLTGITVCESFTFTTSTDEPAVEYQEHLISGGEVVPTINTTAYFTCDDHEVLIGSNLTECTEDGSWTYEKPYCKSKFKIKEEDDQRRRLEDEMTKYVLLRHTVTCELFVVDAENENDPQVTYDNILSFKNTTKRFAVKGTVAHFMCTVLANETRPANLTGPSSTTCGGYGLWDHPWKPSCDRHSYLTTTVAGDPAVKVVTEFTIRDLIEQIIAATLLVIIVFIAIAAIYSSFLFYKKQKVFYAKSPVTPQPAVERQASPSKPRSTLLRKLAPSSLSNAVTISMSEMNRKFADSSLDIDLISSSSEEEQQLLSSTENIKRPLTDFDSSASDGDPELVSIFGNSAKEPSGYAVMKLDLAASLDSNMNEVM
ncbi:Acetylcholinesterase [Halotydeus destructor]|nr:Acetylcholinesterase [Halotydeus destructor]